MMARALIIGLVLVSGLGVAAVMLTPEPPAAAMAEAPPARVAVLVAANPVQGGTLLRIEDVGAREVAPGELPEDAIRDTQAARLEVAGAMVRRSLPAGDLLRAGALLRPGDHGFLAAVLAPGARAVTVGVDAVSGTAGLIWPGDRVDVILTQTLDEGEQPPGRRVLGERVLNAVRVIAVDRSLVQGAQPGGLADPLREGNRTVTLEVSAEQATRVAVAARLGRLSLSVRAAGTPAGPAEAMPMRVWGGDVSPGLMAGRSGGGSAVRVFKGPQNVEEIRFR
ncbi:Flp pilus assembly protein CpaB [Roseomonas sp. NAR14]|uniref:Flp pilus assembly protein CpaB n=1 Tax=Roseomonas acroporae TaxID=2937791 RepID=A0A9X1Y9S5_9PROT|nr:Flp pilus assembly protein CpaB [Roseomonas acroporae]MCK8785752.1 Flp pilus assembly protein CpaB [Roseomonas acroporae]